MLSNINSIHTKKWVKSLSENGCEIMLFGLEPPEDNFYENLLGVKISHSDFYDQNRLRGIKKIKYLKVISSLKVIYREFQPQIVHAHYATSYGLLGTFLKHKPYLISVWGTDVFLFPNESFINKIILKRNLNKADYIFSTSKIMAKETSKYTSKNVAVVPFGVDLSFFKATKKHQQQDFITIGTVKTLELSYGIKYLIQAFKIIAKKNQNTQLLIAGQGNQKKILENLCRELDLQNVTFLGKLPHEEVPNLLNQLDIVVIPSLRESFGVAAIEASACEKPVVASNVGGLPEVVEDGITGFLSKAGDSNDLADKISLLINDKQLRINMGKAGRKKIELEYEWEKNVDLMLKHYKKINAISSLKKE